MSVVRSPGGGAQVQVPVDDLPVRLRFRLTPTAHLRLHSAGVSVDAVKFSQLAGPRQLAGKGEVRYVPPLSTGLKDASGAAHRVMQDEALLDVFRARFFAVDVFASASGVHRSGAVPVRTGGDQHGVNVLSVQQFAEVTIGRASGVAVMPVGELLDLAAAFGLHIADGQKLDVGLLQEVAQHDAPPVSDADPAHRNPLAGGYRPISAEGGTGNNLRRQGGRAGRKRRLQKPAAGETG